MCANQSCLPENADPQVAVPEGQRCKTVVHNGISETPGLQLLVSMSKDDRVCCYAQYIQFIREDRSASRHAQCRCLDQHISAFGLDSSTCLYTFLYRGGPTESMSVNFLYYRITIVAHLCCRISVDHVIVSQYFPSSIDN